MDENDRKLDSRKIKELKAAYESIPVPDNLRRRILSCTNEEGRSQYIPAFFSLPRLRVVLAAVAVFLLALATLHNAQPPGDKISPSVRLRSPSRILPTWRHQSMPSLASVRSFSLASARPPGGHPGGISLGKLSDI